MNALLWILQLLLALHTLMGALWKFSSSAEQTMASLAVISPGIWLAMSVIEILLSVGLVIPLFNKRLSRLGQLAAVGIVIEMIIFCGIHLFSGDTSRGPLVYWLVVAGLCGFLAYSRRSKKV